MQKWFAVRCVFRAMFDGPQRYEERITLWRAESAEAAIALAEEEAADYADLEDGLWEYVGLAQSYHLFDEPGHGAEVFSLIRESELPPGAYLDAFFDTGRENQDRVG